jgi:signal transduction histidine kinase
MHKIEQVIINLITNACQALENSEQGISLKAGTMSESGNEPGMVFVCVTDEGKGMSRAVMERIKTPFFTTRRHKDGTGLGLSISDTIIREHGGTLEFESSPGKGTTATILLPVSR